MSKHLKIKPAAPWHWDGQDPLDMDNRIGAQSLRAPVVRNVREQSVEVTDGEGWDVDGLGR